MEKLIIIFSFTKTFYEAYHQKLPLDNYPELLQKLLNLDIISFIKDNEDKAIEKANFWQEEAYRNFDRIGKIGIAPSTELNLDSEPSELWDCSFMRAVRVFNKRNFYVASCLSNKKSFKENENLIKSQIKLDAFKGIPLLLPCDELVKKISNNTHKQPVQDKFSKHNLQIQQKYIDRFINSLLVYTLVDSKEDLKKLLQGHNIFKPIEFSCPANSVITFFRERHEDGVIISSKSITKQFIHTFFLFKNNKTKIYQPPSLSNINNFLTRETPPSGTLKKIIFIE